METILVSPPTSQSPPYPVLIGSGALGELPRVVRDLEGIDSIVVLYDEAVKEIAQRIQKALCASLIIPVASGEGSKTFSEAGRIVTILLQSNVTRQALMVNVGGGMVTDLGGLVAAGFKRGMNSVNVPTSLLGMVDASVGGKTAVNVGAKNAFGFYHHPRAVVADTDTLVSLPDRQMREGLVEVVKIAAMRDAEFFTWLEEHVQKVIAKTREELLHCIERAVALKVDVCDADERDEDVRMQLNFGHTVGHPLEELSNHRISHGQAVSMGMVEEMRMANVPAMVSRKVRSLLQGIGMPIDLPHGVQREEIYRHMRNDKKCAGDQIRIAVPTTIGSGSIVNFAP